MSAMTNLQNYILAQRAENTVKKIEYGLNVWKRFSCNTSENKEIEDVRTCRRAECLDLPFHDGLITGTWRCVRVNSSRFIRPCLRAPAVLKTSGTVSSNTGLPASENYVTAEKGPKCLMLVRVMKLTFARIALVIRIPELFYSVWNNCILRCLRRSDKGKIRTAGACAINQSDSRI